MAKKLLSEIVNIKTGHSFRGTVKRVVGGGAYAIQARDITMLGEFTLNTVIETEFRGKREPDWIKKGDVIFISKGWRTTACYIEQDWENLTSVSSLYILRAKPEWQDHINMEFIAWLINQPPAQKQIRRNAEGVGHVNVRKQTLGELVVGVPPLDKQDIIAKLYKDSVSEQKLITQLIHNRAQQGGAIAAALLG